MDIVQAIILGIVEGITEFLPISSTGHLILGSKLLGLSSTDFVKSFEIFIQSGAILAVIILYWKELLTSKNLILKVFVAFLPTALVGLLFYKAIKLYLLGNTEITLWALFLGGIILILVELYFKRSVRFKESKNNPAASSQQLVAISHRQAFQIGLMQSISIIPGVSRAAASIVGGMITGLSREQAVKFSFLLAVPTLLAATGLDLVSTSFNFSYNEWVLLCVGFSTSFIVAFITIKWLLSYVKHHSFIAFGIYRITIAILLYLFTNT